MSYLDKFLLKAVLNGSLDDVSEYIAEHADVDAVDSNGRSGLYHAAAAGNEDMIKLLLVHKGDPNLADDDGVLPLSASLLEKNYSTAKLLLDNGAKANLPAGDKKMTALHAAINMDLKDHTAERVTFLLENGADANGAANAAGYTPYAQAKAYIGQWPDAEIIVNAMAVFAEGQEVVARRLKDEFIAAETSRVFSGSTTAAKVKTVRFAAPKGPR